MAHAAVFFDNDGVVTGYRIRLNDLKIKSAKNSYELDKAFVSTIVAAGHEAEHASQFNSKDPEMALYHIVRSGNEDNYIENYIYNRREIAAEHSGIIFARSYLSKTYPDMDIDAMLLGYVNDSMKNGPYYISYDWLENSEPKKSCNEQQSIKPKEFRNKPKNFKPKDAGNEEKGFTSMDDVKSAFEDAYEAAAQHVNKYDSCVSKYSKDAFAILTGAGSGNGLNDEWMFMFDALSVSKDAHESNMILASAALHVYPEFARETAGAELPDLSIQAVFGREPPCTKDKPKEDAKAGQAYSRLMALIADDDNELEHDDSYGLG